MTDREAIRAARDRVRAVSGRERAAGQSVWILNHDAVLLLDALDESEAEIARLTEERNKARGEHDFQRTIATDGRWCQRCGLSESKWVGDPCAGRITPEFEAIVVALRSRLSEATELLRQLNTALSCEWPGIADRLDGTDLQGIPTPLSEAWELSRAALIAVRAFLSEVTE